MKRHDGEPQQSVVDAYSDVSRRRAERGAVPHLIRASRRPWQTSTLRSDVANDVAGFVNEPPNNVSRSSSARPGAGRTEFR